MRSSTRARRLASTDPRRTIAEIRASDPVSLLAPAESLETINAVQAVMASIEGLRRARDGRRRR